MTSKDEFVLSKLIAQLEKTTDETEIETLKAQILELDPDMEFTDEDETE
jgi:hypothetical protein